ncbi:GNAT family N-acetyltransferase [Neotamlana laminarinivorans]|uniref:GNAT family N-acetyltransferase n=1 Tax=Neotamlana laminarinivorans TaxID=2883124 RepID=A0A9X1L377_9FLAO|nr:GNAT family N-acetyltransferase [Tamlana laminarinivorans]MCB4798284.1 GNAT family N-acetyltransferase [Tamlana laminarinivorans]
MQFKIYTSVNELPENWDGFVSHDVFLQTPYFKAIKQSSPDNISWFFVGVFKNENLVGVAVIQRVALYLKDIFRDEREKCIRTFLQDTVAKILKGNILVVGNLMHTGQHAFYFNEALISYPEFLQGIFKAIDEIKTLVKRTQNKKIRVIMLKDFFETNAIHKETVLFNQQKLYQVKVQPNMLLPVTANWLKFDDYTASLTKKYRDRYKRAKKKLNDIQVKDLSLVEIEKLQNIMHEFYLNVSNNAKFNTFILPKNHFYSLKENLQDNFKVFGYFLNEELVGFYTLILNEDNLETYFLGYHQTHQYKNQLYLNMLYDMLKFGIENKFKTIVYARTAMAIKSSVGAEAKNMFVYMKHTNVLINGLLKQIFKLMNPKQDWEERHPFKT